MPETLTVEDLGSKVKLKYPGVYDDIPDAEVGAKVKAKYPGAYDDFTDQPRKIANGDSAPSRFLKNLWEQVNPAAVVGGIASTALHPLDTLRGVMSENQRLADEAVDAAKKGDYATAVRKGLSYAAQVVPGAGSTLDAAATQAEQGDIAGSAGKSMGLGAQIALTPKAVPVAARGVEAVQALPSRIAEAVQKPGSIEIARGAATYGAGLAVPVVGPLLREAGRADIRAGIAARRAGTKAPPIAEAVPPVYDEIAKALGGKDYTSLDPAGQASVRRFAAPPTAAPRPASVQPASSQSVPFEPPPSKYAAQMALRDRLTSSERPANVQPAEVAEPKPATAAAPATEPRPVVPAPQPTQTPAPQVSGTRAVESPRPSGPGTVAEMAKGKQALLTPEIMTEDALAKHATSHDVPLEDARKVVEDAGYKVVGRSYLNRALHGLGNEMGLDHDAISTKAAQDYGVKSLTQLSQEQLLEMLNDLQGKRSISEPLPKKKR